MRRLVSDNPPCQYLRDPAAFTNTPNPPPVTVRDANRALVKACLIQQRWLYGIRQMWMPAHNTIHQWAKHLQMDERRLGAYYKGHRWLELDIITTINTHLGPAADSLWLDVNEYAARATRPTAPPTGNQLPGTLLGYVVTSNILTRPWRDPQPLPPDSPDYMAIIDGVITAIEAKHLPPPDRESILVYAIDHRIPTTITGDQEGITITIHAPGDALPPPRNLGNLTISSTGDQGYELSQDPLES